MTTGVTKINDFVLLPEMGQRAGCVLRQFVLAPGEGIGQARPGAGAPRETRKANRGGSKVIMTMTLSGSYTEPSGST
eukprot:1557712-Karenia_brevis.AAC.1